MDKRELYDQAKEAYYNGEPIMTDLEFDELEKELGLENQGYIGTHHQKSYTIRHPFIMGSLSKIQIKEDDKHVVNWLDYQKKVMDYLRKSNGYGKVGWFFEATPKYDGCSWEAVIDHQGNLVSVSTRGDGEYGKDIKVWFEEEWKKNYEPYVMDYYKSALDEQSYFFLKYLVVRGECLVKKSVFEEKYSIGDIIILDDFRGTVKDIGVRTTTIEDAGKNLKVVNNSDIRNFQNRSRNTSVASCEVSVSYETDLENLERLLSEKLPAMYEAHPDLYLAAPQYLGVTQLADSGVQIKLIVETKEENVFAAQRMLTRDIRILFADAGVDIPFPQVVVHKA